MTTPTTDQTDDTTTREEGKGNSEAARHRVRARQAEVERDLLAARVARLQTGELHRLASQRMADPDDLRVHGVDLADLLDDDGDLDEAKVEQAVDDLLTKRPRLAIDYLPDTDGLDGGARTHGVGRPVASWSGVLSGREAQR